MVIGTDSIGSCTSYYHAITTTMAPIKRAINTSYTINATCKTQSSIINTIYNFKVHIGCEAFQFHIDHPIHDGRRSNEVIQSWRLRFSKNWEKTIVQCNKIPDKRISLCNNVLFGTYKSCKQSRYRYSYLRQYLLEGFDKDTDI